MLKVLFFAALMLSGMVNPAVALASEPQIKLVQQGLGWYVADYNPDAKKNVIVRVKSWEVDLITGAPKPFTTVERDIFIVLGKKSEVGSAIGYQHQILSSRYKD